MAKEPVSVLVPTFNAAATLAATLDSVQWADEIVVVDSFSTDETLKIATTHGARVLSHPYQNSASQKNWALPECRCDWVLQLDSDEELSPGLQEEIAGALRGVHADIHAFRIPRKNLFLGQWMRYGGNYPDYQTRLFRRGRGHWQEREVHAHVEVSGHVQTLRYPIIHHDWPTLSKMLERLDRYTGYEAAELRKHGTRFRWFDLLLRPAAAFLYRFVWLHGFRDGWRGLIFCAYTAFYVFMTRAKLWEISVPEIDRSPWR
jgi:glycosyltransferase involved in cell wall biosynthesis